MASTPWWASAATASPVASPSVIIARVLLAGARVVVLDEATASLDSTSEAAVQEALGHPLAGRAAVVIAHRLSAIRHADAILVVEDGRVVEQGTHDELLAADGRYAELSRTQLGRPVSASTTGAAHDDDHPQPALT